MRKWIETTGRSEEDAIAAALFQLGLERDDVSIEVIERAKSGFLGFGGKSPFGGRPKKAKAPRKAVGTPLGRTALNLAVTLLGGAVYY